MRLVIVFAAVVGCGSLLAAERQEIRPTEDVRVEFPMRWMKMLDAAAEDFRKTHSDLSCFNIAMRKEHQGYRVSIMPPVDVQQEGDRISLPVVPGSSSCGRGMYYDFDENGVLTRRTGVR